MREFFIFYWMVLCRRSRVYISYYSSANFCWYAPEPHPWQTCPGFLLGRALQVPATLHGRVCGPLVHRESAYTFRICPVIDGETP